jgi:hypothetical protein
MSTGSSVTDVNPNQPNPNPGVGPPQNKADDSKKGAHDRAKDDKKQANPKPMDPNNPTVASTDGKKTILDAIKQVDPGNVSGFIKKALDAMMMIRSIDAASGMGGGGSLAGGGSSGATTSAAIGKGLIDAAQLLQTAQQLGLKRVLDALNAIMPALIPLLDDDSIQMLDEAILAIITNTNVGVLSPLSMQSATATAQAIAQVQSLSASSTNEQLVSAVLVAATIGGSSLNIDANSLASMILQAAVGQTISTIQTLNGKIIETRVIINSTYIQDQLSNIPSFTGMEQQTIATTVAADVATQLANLITTNTLTAQNFLDTLTNAQAKIQSLGLKNALGGVDINSILGNIQQLISQFAGNIQDSQQDHQPRARLDTVTKALQNHSKILALIKKKIDISDIFQNMGSMAGQATSQMQSAMSSIQSALGSSPIGQALQNSDIIASTSSISSTLQGILQSAQSPLQSLTSTSLNSLLMQGSSMLATLSQTQVQSLLAALPPSLVMSLMGNSTTMFSNLSTQEINQLLSTLPAQTINILLQGNNNLTNFHSSGSSLAEQTSDIAAALTVVIATQAVGTNLTTILPNGTTVICQVLTPAFQA